MTQALDPIWANFADLVDPPVNPYVDDPVGWVQDVLGEHVWSKQAEMMRAPTLYDRTVVKAGHSVGKTRGLSRLVAHWVMNYPIGTALVVITSDNNDQITGGIWRELIQLQAERKQLAERHPDQDIVTLPGNITLDGKWHAGPGNNQLVAVGRKPGDRNPTGLQGYHARHILVIIEECCGVPQEIWEAADSLASNDGGVVLACGNPTDPTAYMATVCKPGSGWHVQQIRSTDTPAFTGEKVDPSLEGVLASRSWVEKRRRMWGANSPQYIARILGEFPEIGDDTLISPKWIEAAQKRSLARNNKPRLGVDVARFGDDETVLMRREGPWFRVHSGHHKMSTTATAGRVKTARDEINTEVQIEEWLEIIIDEDGIGGGVIDQLQVEDVDVIGFHNGATAFDERHYTNRKSELYWQLRRMFEEGEIDIDPADDVLAAQLGSIKWDYGAKSRVKVESKEDMKKRGMPSPDRADAMMMTLALTDGILSDVDEPGESDGSITGDLMTMKW